MRWLSEARERVRAVVFRARQEAEMDEEMRFHVEMEAERLAREEGLGPAEALRRARIAFGGVERWKEELRDARGIGRLAGISLDLRLGVRMLARHPGLTLLGTVAMAFGMAAGATTFEVVRQVVHPTLPLEDGGGIVALRNWDAAEHTVAPRAAYDLAAWRQLRSVTGVGAFQTRERNLATGGEGTAEPVALAEISASAFGVTRVPPLLGRVLVEEDEQPGAPPVAVIGHGLWQSRFGGDPAVVGRGLHLDGALHTVVGVMPPGFAFPVAHGLWVPLRRDALAHPPGEGPALRVFGRLALGATLAGAQAELDAAGARAARDLPRTHRHLRPEVLPYAESFLPARMEGTLRVGAYSANLAAAAFLALLAANIAVLVFARTAARQGEIVVRSALGATRGRIVAQLFAEALVLGGLAAAAGLAAASLGLRWGWRVLAEQTPGIPFWFQARLSPATVVYVAGLTVLGAAIVGVVPALKVTGTRVEGRLRQAAAGGSGLRFGGIWTAVIITQVALTVMVMPLLMDGGSDTSRIARADPGFAAGEFLSARLEAGGEAPPGVLYPALLRRLEADPRVAGVTYAAQLPGAFHRRRWIEAEGAALVPERGWDGTRVQAATVDPGFFATLGVPVMAGRGFHAGDAAEGARVVLVNQSFAEHVLGGRNPVGMRVRYRNGADPAALPTAGSAPGEWYEIAGVVRDVALTVDPDLPHGAGIYHAAPPAAVSPLHVAVRLRGEPASFAPRLRALAAAVDPALRVHDVLSLDEVPRGELATYAFWLRVGGFAGGLLLLLSFAGIYAIMSFTVARRTREIGIRAALGAGSRRIVAETFSRAFAQLGAGVVLGLVLLVGLAGGIHSTRGVVLLGADVALMVAVGMLACALPTLRALRIQPTEALRAEA